MNKIREEFEKTGCLMEVYNEYGSTDPTWDYAIWLENKIGKLESKLDYPYKEIMDRDKEIKKLKDMLYQYQQGVLKL